MKKKPRKHGPGKQGGDRLTDQQRAYALARYENPKRSARECAVLVGFDPRNANRLEKSSAVKLAIASYRQRAKIGDKPLTKLWLQEEMQRIYQDPRTPLNEKVRLLKDMGATVPGFYVPAGVHHSGKFSLESLVESMGGRPTDLPGDGPKSEKEIN